MSTPPINDQPGKATGAGCLFAAAIIIGTIVGAVLRQPAIGALAGVALGLVLAALLWLWDRRG